MSDISREKSLIAVELSEYRRAMRDGHVMRALACLNQANDIGRKLAERLNAERHQKVQDGH